MSSMQEMMYAKRPAWLTFAAIVMFSVGFVRIIYAIYYFANSVRIANLSNGAFSSHLWLWGIWDLGIALLAIWAGYSLLGGNEFGRIIGYAWAILVIIQSFLVISNDPWYATTMLVLASLVIYALAATSEYREPGGGPTEGM